MIAAAYRLTPFILPAWVALTTVCGCSWVRSWAWSRRSRLQSVRYLPATSEGDRP